MYYPGVLGSRFWASQMGGRPCPAEYTPAQSQTKASCPWPAPSPHCMSSFGWFLMRMGKKSKIFTSTCN